MVIKLDELNNNNEIEFKYEVNKDEELDSRIIDLKDSFVSGSIFYDVNDDIILSCIFNGKMIINDSVTLEKISYEFSIEIEEKLSDLEENYIDIYDNNQNTLDLKKVLWQNIVLEVPISYTLNKDANLKGDGWELNSESKNEDIDPRFEKLDELLKGDDI